MGRYNDLTKMNANWDDALKALAFVENAVPKIVSALEVIKSIIEIILKAIQGISFPPNPAVLVDMLNTFRQIFKQVRFRADPSRLVRRRSMSTRSTSSRPSLPNPSAFLPYSPSTSLTLFPAALLFSPVMTATASAAASKFCAASLASSEMACAPRPSYEESHIALVLRL